MLANVGYNIICIYIMLYKILIVASIVIFNFINRVEKLKTEPGLLPLHKLGAWEKRLNPKVINFGLLLPGVSVEEDYKLWVRIIHEKDIFTGYISS